METITKKTISIEYAGKKYSLSDNVTLEIILVQLGLAKDTPVRMTKTKNGFLIIPQI